jgi:hypothetical protein
MIVRISADVFANEGNTQALERLWFVIETGHKLLVKTEEEIAGIRQSGWYLNSSKTIRESVDVMISWAINIPPSKSARIRIGSGDELDYFSVVEATAYLKQQFVILLENSNNDSFFFDSLLFHFPEEGHVIKQYKDEHLLRYGMGGGSTIEDVIETVLNSFQAEMFKKAKHKYLRYFVLVDSDRISPSMDLGPTKNNLIAYLTKNEVDFHILEKREIENYLPDEAFREIENNREYVESYLRLSQIQKDFFDIEKGFDRNKNFRDLADQVKELYENLSPGDKSALRSGSLERINTKDKKNFKTDFPKLFISKNVKKETLLRRCSHHSNDPASHPYDKNELPNLLKKITELL